MLRPLLAAALLAFAGPAAGESIKIAFVADSGMSANTRKVFELIRSEGAGAVIHLGDLGYDEDEDDSPRRFEEILKATLQGIPFYAALGNHDEKQRGAYVAMLGRLDSGKACTGKRGVKAVCSVSGVDVVFTARPGRDSKFLKKSLSNSTAKWKVCAWHEPDPVLHPGKNDNGPGKAPYAACLAAGAMVASGHQHHYSRTYLLESYKTRKVASQAAVMKLEPGRSFSFVAGAGGAGKLDDVEAQPWDGGHYARKQGVKGYGGGALFCEFADVRAECYFKAIDGKEYDRFTLESGL